MGSLALGAGIAGHHDIGFVVEDAALSELLVALDIGLAIVGHQLDRLLGAVDLYAARVINFLDGQLVTVGFRCGHDRKVA